MFKPYQMFDGQDIDSIHEASLEVLEKIGLFVDHKGAQKKMAEAGAKVDAANNRIFITKELVENALQVGPKSFTSHGRDPKFDLEVSSTATPFMRMDCGCITFHDMITGKSRRAELKDIKTASILGEAFEHMGTTSFLTVSDVPDHVHDVVVVAEILKNSRKPFWMLTTDSKIIKFQLKLCEAVAGGSEAYKKRPLGSGILSPISPLKLPYDEVERMMVYGEHNVPIRMPLSPMSGANAPYTLAGSVVQTNAEFLGVYAMVQSMFPGLPMWYYPLLQILDMRKGAGYANSPEVQLMYAAHSQLAAKYDLPYTGSQSKILSCQPDQTLFQYGSSLLWNVMQGYCEIGSAGGVDSSSAFCPQVVAVCNEIMGYAKRMRNGFEINKETIGFDAILQGSKTGEFISIPHTMQHLRKEERFVNSLIDHTPCPEWLKEPVTLFERADAMVNEVLATHEQELLSDDLIKELNEICVAADKELS